MRTLVIITTLFGLSACDTVTDTVNNLVPGTSQEPLETVASTASGPVEATPVSETAPQTPEVTAAPTAGTGTSIVEDPTGPAPSGGLTLYTVASLGDPTKPGMWMETPLVQSEQTASVRLSGTSKATQVKLVPISGDSSAGSRLSLEAYRALGADLTELVNLDVVTG